MNTASSGNSINLAIAAQNNLPAFLPGKFAAYAIFHAAAARQPPVPMLASLKLA